MRDTFSCGVASCDQGLLHGCRATMRQAPRALSVCSLCRPLMCAAAAASHRALCSCGCAEAGGVALYIAREGRRRNTVCCSCTSRICWRSRRERVCCARGDKEPLHTEKRPARASRCRQMQAKCTDFRVIRVQNAKIFPRLRRGGPPAAPAASCPMSVCALTGTHQPRLEPHTYNKQRVHSWSPCTICAGSSSRPPHHQR